ncbi:transposase InsO family protein [Arthrobacter sp. V4I6]|nr:transposase InsO family protein [Arthrobacter sp. V1I7]MDQ0854675.1 transposase InsO family protein [Arthrobacter sp. V4I6]
MRPVYRGQLDARIGRSHETDDVEGKARCCPLDHAVALRQPAGTVVHSDSGPQFRSRRFVLALHTYGLIGSMGRVCLTG